MKLSQFQSEDLKIIQDGEFDFLVKTSDIFQGDCLTFIEKESYIELLLNNKNITCVITTPELQNKIPNTFGKAISSNPKFEFLRINRRVQSKCEKTVIGKNFIAGKNNIISPYNVIIGNNVTIGDNVVINEGVKIGDNCIIKSNAILGSDGYERCKNNAGGVFLCGHVGLTVIGNDVVIMENAFIERALFAWDKTLVLDGCLVGHNSTISHGSKIGKNTLVMHSAFIAGNVMVGSNSKIGIGAIISNRVVIGNNVEVKLGSVVTTNLSDGAIVSGNFAIDHSKNIQHVKEIAK